MNLKLSQKMEKISRVELARYPLVTVVIFGGLVVPRLCPPSTSTRFVWACR